MTDSSKLMKLVLVLIVCSTVSVYAAEFRQCEVDVDGKPVCNKTAFYGHCGKFLDPQSDKWCSYGGQQDLCCARTADECCVRQSSPLLFITIVVLISVLALTCCWWFVRWACCHPPFRRHRPGVHLNFSVIDNFELRNRPKWDIEATKDFVSMLKQRGFKAEVPDYDDIASPRQPENQATQPTLPAQQIDQKECIVCFNRQRDSLLPCGHFQLCRTCSLHLNNAQCPTCRVPINKFAIVHNKLPSFQDLQEIDPDFMSSLDSAVRAPTFMSTSDLSTNQNEDSLSVVHVDRNSDEHQSDIPSETAPADIESPQTQEAVTLPSLPTSPQSPATSVDEEVIESPTPRVL